VPTYYPAIHLDLCHLNPNLNVSLFELEISTPVTHVLETQQTLLFSQENRVNAAWTCAIFDRRQLCQKNLSTVAK